MKIKSLIIDGIGGIQHLEINFIDSMNVICGANGIGKTTILEIISDAFINSMTPSKLAKNALYKIGKYRIELESNVNGNKQITSKEEVVKKFEPKLIEHHNGWGQYSKDFLYFGINRNIDYIKLNAVSSDPQREEYENSKIATEGIKANDIKNWFVNRYLFLNIEGSLTKEQCENVELAQKMFSILDNKVHFDKVIPSSFDIILTDSKGKIYFEYLSAGYKSCIYIILGIIKEIEYRNSESPILVKDFEGVILIDEIDLHLHPVWQSKLLGALKNIFPQTQFILTTHSPSILQTLQKEEIIALGYDENENVSLKKLNLGKYGLQGWTLEEILKYIMEMPTTTSELYQETLENFDKAMNDENRDAILKYYELLKEMLHPNNPLCKLLSIQVAEWED